MYGAGAAVQEISTAFESQFIIISNLPRDITQTKLIALAECFGNVQTLTIDSSSTSFPIAKIKFAILEDAVRAIKGLNGESFESKRLEARMDLRAVEDGLATLRSTKVKLSWFAPTSQRAWAHYDGITTARQQALALDGKSYNGSKVSAFFQTPKPRQIGSFSVELRGLPRNPPSHSLKIFSSAKSITIDKPSYNLRSAIEEMKVLLSRYGKLESFEVLPVDSKKPKIVAFAQFSSPDAAELAVKGLHSKRQTFLEESPVWLEHVHTLKYMVPALQFAALKQDIDLLGDSQTECKLRYYETDETGRACDSVCIRVFSTESKALGKVKAILDGFMRGELYKTAESGGWDGYFNSPEAQFFLRNLSQRTKGYVRCDARSRTLHLFGTTAARELLKEALGRKLSELAERRHIIHLDRTQLRSLIGGGYKALASLVEEKSLLLNVVKRTLTVTGDKENVRKVREAIALGTTTGHSAEEAPTMAFDSDCPVCFCDPTEPILLPCGHRYCQVCLQHLLRAACSANSSMVTCVMDIEGSDGIEACGTRVPIPVIRNLLEPTEEEDLFKATFLAHIHSRPEEFHYCPSPDCQIIYKQGVEGTVLRCPSCITRICASCHVEFHDGQSCEEYQDLKSGDKAFERWRKTHGAKPCPKCGVTLEKSGGCNHMTCTRCSAHICWVCMRVFSNTDRGDDGVYAHMRREHGGIST